MYNSMFPTSNWFLYYCRLIISIEPLKNPSEDFIWALCKSTRASTFWAVVLILSSSILVQFIPTTCQQRWHSHTWLVRPGENNWAKIKNFIRINSLIQFVLCSHNRRSDVNWAEGATPAITVAERNACELQCTLKAITNMFFCLANAIVVLTVIENVRNYIVLLLCNHNPRKGFMSQDITTGQQFSDGSSCPELWNKKHICRMPAGQVYCMFLRVCSKIPSHSIF